MIKRWIVICFLLLSTTAFSQTYSTVKNQMKKRDYEGALKSLNKMSPSSKRSFHLGMAHKYLGNYKKSAKSFQQAIKAGSKERSVNFEYGQTLYGDNELSRALTQFKKSFARGYEKGTSLYYLGYINQVLENFKESKKYFTKLTKEKNVKKAMIQVGLFQLGEVLISLAENSNADVRKRVKKYVLPKWERALKLAPKAPIAKDIKTRKEEVLKKYGLHPDFYRNGKKIKAKKYRLKAREKFEYDNNITLTSDDPTIVTAEADSFISTTKVTGNYLWVFKQRYFLEPNAELNYVKHTEQDNSAVFSNDQYNMKFGLKSGLEYKLFDKVASNSISLSYGHRQRDRLSKHEKIFDSRTYKVSLAQKIRLIGAGDTSLSISRSNISNALPAADIYSNSFSLSQLLFLKSDILLNALWTSVYTVLPNAHNSDSNTHVMNFTFIFLEILPKYTLALNGGLTFQNTVNQTNRGTEKSYSGSLTLSRKLRKKMTVSLGYKLTEKTSKVKANAYEKNGTTFELIYDF